MDSRLDGLQSACVQIKHKGSVLAKESRHRLLLLSSKGSLNHRKSRGIPRYTHNVNGDRESCDNTAVSAT